eukprot:3392128-Rhodomonas_salina.1
MCARGQGGSGTTPLKKIAVSRTGSKSSLKGDYVKLQVNSPEMAMRQIHQVPPCLLPCLPFACRVEGGSEGVSQSVSQSVRQ